jgi:hypothetical protein
MTLRVCRWGYLIAFCWEGKDQNRKGNKCNRYQRTTWMGREIDQQQQHSSHPDTLLSPLILLPAHKWVLLCRRARHDWYVYTCRPAPVPVAVPGATHGPWVDPRPGMVAEMQIDVGSCHACIAYVCVYACGRGSLKGGGQSLGADRQVGCERSYE